MEKINVNKLLKVDSLYVKGNSKPLRNRFVYIASNFLIVGENEDDVSPTWINIDKVDRLEGVKQLSGPKRSQQSFYMW